MTYLTYFTLTAILYKLHISYVVFINYIVMIETFSNLCDVIRKGMDIPSLRAFGGIRCSYEYNS